MKQVPKFKKESEMFQRISRVREIRVIRTQTASIEDQQNTRENTLIVSKYTPSLVERNLSKRINLKRQMQFIAEPDQNQTVQQDKQTFELKPQLSRVVSARHRIFSNQCDSKPNRKRDFCRELSDSREILLNIQKKNNFQCPKKNTILSTQISQKLNLAQGDQNPLISQRRQSEVLFLQKKVNNQGHEVLKRIKDIVGCPDGDKNDETNTIHKFDEQKVVKVNNDRILDLLLLSTCELKRFFNQGENNHKSHNQGIQKIKLIENNQKFPTDFFNALRKKKH